MLSDIDLIWKYKQGGATSEDKELMKRNGLLVKRTIRGGDTTVAEIWSLSNRAEVLLMNDNQERKE